MGKVVESRLEISTKHGTDVASCALGKICLGVIHILRSKGAIVAILALALTFGAKNQEVLVQLLETFITEESAE